MVELKNLDVETQHSKLSKGISGAFVSSLLADTPCKRTDFEILEGSKKHWMRNALHRFTNHWGYDRPSNLRQHEQKNKHDYQTNKAWKHASFETNNTTYLIKDEDLAGRSRILE